MNDAHIHLLVNHLPIIGAFLSVPLFLVTLFVRDRGAWLGAAVLVSGLAGAGAPVALWTGEPAEEVIEDHPDVSKRQIHEHEERAELATGISVTVALAGFGLLFWSRKRPVPTVAALGLLGGALLSSGAMAWTGAAGGPIRHTELRDTSAGEAAVTIAREAGGPGRGTEKGEELAEEDKGGRRDDD